MEDYKFEGRKEQDGGKQHSMMVKEGDKETSLSKVQFLQGHESKLIDSLHIHKRNGLFQFQKCQWNNKIKIKPIREQLL